MKKNLLYTFLISTILLLSGCNVADKINEDLLGIEDKGSEKIFVPQEDNSSVNDGNTDINDTNGNSNGGRGCEAGTYLDTISNTCLPYIVCEAGTHLDTSTNVCIVDENTTITCQTGFHLENGKCKIIDSNITIIANEFNLTLPEYENKKSINIKIGKNDSKIITIRSDPKQTDMTNKLEVFQFTNNSVATLIPMFDGAPRYDQNYDFTIRITSKDTPGKDEFQITLDNANGFTDSVYINVEVIDQITLSGVRNRIYPYTAVTDGDEQNITITAYNLLDNPLKFEIINREAIIEEGNLLLIINGSSKFHNTVGGVDFKFSVRGLEDDKREVEIRVTDTVTGTIESIFITIESVRRNTQFYADLYECGEEYNSNNYEETSDANTDQSPNGLYSADRAIYLKSINNMDYDIGNKFSTVMLFHPTNGAEYSYDSYGKEYLTNLDTGKKVAVLYYAKHLQGLMYFIKYYNEDKNSIVCEKRYFGFIDAVNTQPDSLESLIIPEIAPSNPWD